MLMGKDNSIYIRDFLAQHLLAEIRTTVYKNAKAVYLYECRGAESVVLWIL